MAAPPATVNQITARVGKNDSCLPPAALIQKNVWVPAAFASALMAFALELRRKAGMLLPTDPPEGNGASHDGITSKLVDGQAPVIKQAAGKLADGKRGNRARSRAKR